MQYLPRYREAKSHNLLQPMVQYTVTAPPTAEPGCGSTRGSIRPFEARIAQSLLTSSVDSVCGDSTNSDIHTLYIVQQASVQHFLDGTVALSAVCSEPWEQAVSGSASSASRRPGQCTAQPLAWWKRVPAYLTRSLTKKPPAMAAFLLLSYSRAQLSIANQAFPAKSHTCQ